MKSCNHLRLMTGLFVFGLSAAVPFAAAQTTRRPLMNENEPQTMQATKIVRLKMLTVQDEMLNQAAFTILAPQSWDAKGKVYWRANVGVPAALAFVASNPGTVEQIQIYPHLPFVDGITQSAVETASIAGPLAMQHAANAFPEGGNYCNNEIRKVMTPVQYVQDVLIKRGRQDIKNYKVTAVENLPEWAKASSTVQSTPPGMRARSVAARVRVEYAFDGKNIQEDFYVNLVAVEILKCWYWGAESASSVRAESGKLAEIQPLHLTVVQSMKIDPSWYNRFMQASQILLDMSMQQQKHIMDISRIITQTNNQISKTISDSYWNRQKVLDKCNQQFSDVIRGVDHYTLPDGQTKVTLPSGYNNVWVSGLGEYVLTNDSFFNPNHSLKGNWQKAKQGR